MTHITRLLDSFAPEQYDLHINMSERALRRFHGVVKITGNLKRAKADITLHAHELTIERATIDGAETTHSLDQKTDELILEAGRELQPGPHTIEITFSGTITDPMHGLYPCYFKLDGQDEELLATQFESHHAREVFPCIDEPAAKATFDLTLVTELGVTVIANTPIKSQHDEEGLTTTFETTPVMSPYLLSWVSGKLAYRESKTKGGVIVRTYATPGNEAQTAFALETAVRILELYNDYFAIDYPLPKCDLIALPDFSPGAMENWGCITFRETALLVDEQNTPLSRKQYVALVVAHELAHQWFGNLVTMQWWNDLWLNESFATWIEYLAVDRLFPEWHIWTTFFTDETTPALSRDSLASVQRVQQEVSDPAEIAALFDGAIVYGKGANLLHMLHRFIGAESFRKGLQLYLKRHQYANATANDLWQALNEASGQDVGAFMQPWIAQPGHPLLHVTQNDNSLHLEQQRFFVNPKEAVDDKTLWPVPLLRDSTQNHESLEGQAIDVRLHDPEDSLFVNRGRAGFYSIAYTPEHTKALADAIQTGTIGEIDRLGLLNDSLLLARSGVQSSRQSLELLEAYAHETNEPVWSSIAGHINALKILINADPKYKPLLQLFVLRLGREQFERLGWEPRANESHNDTLLRPLIVSMMCYGEEPAVLAHARDLFAKAEKPSDIAKDIRTTIFSVVARHDGEPAFTKLLDWYHARPSAEESLNLAAGLTTTEEPALFEQLIAMLTTKDVRPQDLYYWFVYLMRNRHSRQATWQWMQTHWDWIKKTFGADMAYDVFPSYSATAFSTEEELTQYREFFEPMLSDPGLRRAITQGIESIETRILWRARDLAQVVNYLERTTADQTPELSFVTQSVSPQT